MGLWKTCHFFFDHYRMETAKGLILISTSGLLAEEFVEQMNYAA